MNRYKAFTIKILDWSNSEFWELISKSVNEGCLYDQPNFKTDGVVWFEPNNVPNKLFKFSHCFNWLSGSVRLWIKDKPLTVLNYRTAHINKDESVSYTYVDYNLITDIAPITKEEV